MIDERLAPYGALALRVALGVMFIAHAYLKLAVFGIDGFAGFLGQVGLPSILAWPIILAELIGGIAILVGFYGRLVSFALLPVLLGALVVHAPNGWLFNAPNGGWEYPAFLAVAALAQALIGDGALAVKTLRSRELAAAPTQEPEAQTHPPEKTPPATLAGGVVVHGSKDAPKATRLHGMYWPPFTSMICPVT